MELVPQRSLPTPTPELSKSLSPQDLQEHRAGIASEVSVVLSAYFQPNEAEDIKAAQLAWWCDELQDWTREQVVWGLREWNRKNPDRRPTPGHIVDILKRARGQKHARTQQPLRSEPEPNIKPVTAERADEILREVGIRINRFGAVDV